MTVSILSLFSSVEQRSTWLCFYSDPTSRLSSEVHGCFHPDHISRLSSEVHGCFHLDPSFRLSFEVPGCVYILTPALISRLKYTAVSILFQRSSLERRTRWLYSHPDPTSCLSPGAWLCFHHDPISRLSSEVHGCFHPVPALVCQAPKYMAVFSP